MPALNVYLTQEEYDYAKSCGKGYIRAMVQYEMHLSQFPPKKRWKLWPWPKRA